MTLDIPSDVWFHIAKFIPVATLRNLYGLNSAFLQLAFDLRYRSVQIRQVGRRDVGWLLRLRDPYVAKYVRNVWLEAIIERDTNKEVRTDWRQRFRDLTRTVLNKPPLTRPISPRIGTTSSASEMELVQGVIDALTALANVTKLTVGWWEPEIPYHCPPILDAAFSTFGSNITLLTFGGNLDAYSVFFHKPLVLPVLSDLRLELIDTILHQDRLKDADILQNKLLPFVNSLAGQLRSFWVTSFAPIELSTFFSSLGDFPLLDRLQFRIPFNRAFSSDLDAPGLKRLLQSHSRTLKNVVLRLNPASSMVDPATETSLSTWLTSLLATDPRCVSNLQVLQIYPTMLPSGSEIVYSSVRRSAKTLTRLIVRDRYLSLDEVNGLVGLFNEDGEVPGGNLRELVLNVRTLTVKVLDALAYGLPNLSDIELRVGDHVSTTENNAHAETFRTEIQNRSYTAWKVRELGVWQGGAELDSDTLKIIGDAIPSVKSFFGRGGLDEPYPPPGPTWPGSRFV